MKALTMEQKMENTFKYMKLGKLSSRWNALTAEQKAMVMRGVKRGEELSICIEQAFIFNKECF